MRGPTLARGGADKPERSRRKAELAHHAAVPGGRVGSGGAGSATERRAGGAGNLTGVRALARRPASARPLRSKPA